ncbi:hypothetical protein RHO12_03275 [Orbus sturtevantii]|uniref:hypothetical protein n=1 Tax=Orbus sturtevantii TaxID=3074109 RepID=UPI00370D75A7
MTKLTKQEIEKEREEFELFILDSFKIDVSGLYREINNCYSEYSEFKDDDLNIDSYWTGWLARAELAKGE